MNRYQRFVEWTRILALFAAVFLADTALKRLDHGGVRPLYVTAIVGLVAIATLHIAELLTVRIVENWPALKRWLLTEQWIEGMWFDEVVGQNHFALLTIAIVQGEIKVSGEQYDASGAITATWESIVAHLDGGTLRAIYRSPQFRGGHVTEITGYSTYVFTGLQSSPPNFYSGFFVDGSDDGRRCQLRGTRLQDYLQIQNLADPRTRRTELPRLIEQHRRALAAQASRATASERS